MSTDPVRKSASDPRRVAFVHDTTDNNLYGGMDKYELMLLQAFDKSRYIPAVVVPGYTDRWRSASERFIGDVQALGVPVLRLPCPGDRRGVNIANDLKNMVRLFKAAHVDVMHIHTCYPAGARKATLAAWLAGVPVRVRTEHFPPRLIATRKLAYSVKPFDWMTHRIIAVSDANRREQIEFLYRSPSKLYLSYVGSELDRDISTLGLTAAKQAIGLDPAIPVVGVVGRLVEQKGITFFIDAAAAIFRRYGSVNFLVVGDGEWRQRLEEQAARLDIADHTHFVGWQDNPIPYIGAMDVAVMPSLYEGLPLALLDFMAMGKAIVATKVDGNIEAIVDNESGLLVEAGSGEALAQGILALLRDPARAATLGEGARQRAGAQFSIRRLADDMMGLYDRIYSSSHTRRTSR